MADPGKIGKYQILERIGRGGMGTIFKAHDPILNRAVALKVISTDIDVTDEIRTRFFREAQACARLSHPNIVTVYDMGEDAGRMFIVMELLDGVELHRLIADRAPLALEDKLAVMVQVCDGLSYAHQRGIVHRDIKPSNIMRLRDGQVKILDFGIAQMENLHETLTRTGLFMGTPRYMAPEQAGGRADHRADIFSVGAVFYEFLCGQPPFTAKDPFQLLEQIRIEEPRALHLVDATIPSELSDIVARAMRKDPAQRFPDLAQMRMPIAQAQRALADEVRRLGQQIRAQRDQLRRLQGAVADRLGSSNEDLAPPIAEPRHLAALQALERDLQARIEAARSLLSRADALAPSFERGTELLQAGRLTDAIAVFETISADMPEHAQVAEALARARAQAESERHRVLVHPSPDQQVLSAAGEAEDIADATVQRDAWRQSAGHSVVETAAWQLREVAPNGAARATGEKGRRWTFWAGWSLVALAGVAAIVIALAVSSSRSSRTAPGSPVTASSTPANPPAPTASSTPANPPAPTASSTPTNPPAPTASSTPANPPAPTASSTPATPPAPSGGSQSAPVSPSAGQVASVEQSVSKPAQSPRVEEREAARIPPDRPERPDEGGARNRPAEDQRDIEQTWAQLAGAKREADRAAAAFYAPKLLAMAQAKEKAAIEARQRSDHGAVTRLAAEAQSAYLAAARGAKREAEAERQTAPLRARVEQARAAVLARRQEALASDAERLAMDQIRAAETRHVEADALAARQSYAEAARAYDEAAARYTEAALRAKASTSK